MTTTAQQLIELSAGPLAYEDTGSDGPVLVLHGLLMDASLWAAPIAQLSAAHRCVAPTLPLVGNDTGGALVQLLMAERAARVGRVILVSCETFDNFPPV